MFAPDSLSLSVNDFKCSGIILSIFKLSPIKDPIIIYVPAWILSGIASTYPLFNF